MDSSRKFVPKFNCGDYLINYDKTTGCGECKTCGKRVNWSTKRIFGHKNSKNCNDTTFAAIMSNLQSLEIAETSSSSAVSAQQPQSGSIAVLGNISQYTINMYENISRFAQQAAFTSPSNICKQNIKVHSLAQKNN